MEVVALVSGGKDSCFAMMRCFDYGHKVVALANLLPFDDDVDELDSYMFQTVGHQIVASYANCMGLPLFRRRIRGSSREQRLNYSITPGDEVEDMYILLHEVKRQIPSINAVSSGAIASDYQRLRVENVCSRLGLVSLAYLWKQDQHFLLEEMIQRGIVAVAIKVAAMGLKPDKHLGKELCELKVHLLQLNENFGINICGEGGEYETLTLDCPLFHNARIILDEFKIVLHSSDSIAPVGILHPLVFRLENKTVSAESIFENGVKLKSLNKLVEVTGDIQPTHRDELNSSDMGICGDSDSLVDTCVSRIGMNLFSICCWTQNSSEASSELQKDLAAVLRRIELQLKEENLGWANVLYIHLYISNMKQFALANEIYVKFVTEKRCHLGVPSRSTVELPLRQSCIGNAFVEVLVADELVKRVLHVQSISCWAPSCIGPYSQATVYKEVLYMAGQLGLDPPTMQLVPGGPLLELEQALQNSEAVANTFNISLFSSTIHLVVYLSARVSSSESFDIDKKLHTVFGSCINKPTILYVVASDLPKGACIEIKPVLYVPEDDELQSLTSSIPDDQTVEHSNIADSCYHIHRTRNICSAVVSITYDLAAKICGEHLNPSCCPEKHIKPIVSFCALQLAKILVDYSFSWDDVVMLRVYYPVKIGIAAEKIKMVFTEAFTGHSETARRNTGQSQPAFVVVPVSGSYSSGSEEDVVTCELFAVKPAGSLEAWR